MLKKILVGIDGSGDSFDAFNYGLEMAANSGAELQTLFVIDQRKTQIPYIYAGNAYDISYERVYIPPDPELRSFYDKVERDLRKFAENCMDRCREDAKKAGVSSVEKIMDGFPAEKIILEARSADLLIIGQRGENAQFKRNIVGSTTEDIIRRTPRPVLVCPRGKRIIKRVLFPYDGSRSSENALRYYINYIKEISEEFIIILSSEEGGKKEQLESEMSFLKQHEVMYTVVERGGPIQDMVLEYAREESTDLILIGSHGKKKLVDFILGSVTSHLVRKSEIPVLIVY